MDDPKEYFGGADCPREGAVAAIGPNKEGVPKAEVTEDGTWAVVPKENVGRAGCPEPEVICRALPNRE